MVVSYQWSDIMAVIRNDNGVLLINDVVTATPHIFTTTLGTNVKIDIVGSDLVLTKGN